VSASGGKADIARTSQKRPLSTISWFGLLTLGREPAFREKLLQFARLHAGETVLDVGCGTGSLAIAAKRQVGSTGRVYGIDASAEMIARALKKARKAGVEIGFKNSPAQKLPFPDAQFDAVLSTMMLHHLPRKGREDCAREIRRVLKPGGRVLAVDFGVAGRERGACSPTSTVMVMSPSQTWWDFSAMPV
jgi:ubiquinone/menaquinone biosynthesis C-methylase UbiE